MPKPKRIHITFNFCLIKSDRQLNQPTKSNKNPEKIVYNCIAIVKILSHMFSKFRKKKLFQYFLRLIRFLRKTNEQTQNVFLESEHVVFFQILP